MVREVSIEGVRIGGDAPLVVIAGPCVIEGRDLCLRIAEETRAICERLGLGYIFKASFDKANRSSISSPRGPGLDEGLRILDDVRRAVGVPLLTDVHSVEQVAPAAEVVDVLQIPAFLCRQTDLLVAAARTGRGVNVKKGQFLAPWDMKNVVGKVTAGGNHRLLLTERGTSFGYNTLVVDMRGLAIQRAFGYPVIFDATHSVQEPGGLGSASGGKREFVPTLLRAAVAAGVDGLFLEVHPDPDHGLSDGPNMWPLHLLADLLAEARDLDAVARRWK
ncbi:MAG: 3-deoxy-8-phosphooctulonate synthase [Armatimonadetes bacterium]|jgi:2-dehydro-3-deoxyphosphooctonate aldolase (KDO 8-P synthase)|nr:3-deoxy-8-phosphooctulonate synthase [Armatimonadota bacterium]